MTDRTPMFRMTKRRRRATGVALVASLWLKALVLAVGLAQPVQAAGADTAPSAEQDLLAALHVICTSSGTQVLDPTTGATDTEHPSTAKSGLLDCARCCCAPTHHAPDCLASRLVSPPHVERLAAIPQPVLPGEHQETPGNPRAPPHSVLA